jgi:uncharacterized membrane protein
METVAWVFRLRWLLWATGAFVLALLLIPGIRPGFKRLETALNRHFALSVFFLCSGFFFFALLGKLSQVHALAVNSQDFWLFEDMLRQMLAGAPFLTRFAPQSAGWVQHGAVHGFFAWYLTLPLAWLFNPINACLIFGPLAFALAGGILAVLARPVWGGGYSVIICALFLLSSQVGKVLSYDVHPEAIYPLFVFLWAWAAGFTENKVKLLPLVAATLVGVSIKEDSFLVFFPLIALLLIRRQDAKTTSLASVAALAATAIQFIAVAKWSTGAWGPSTWEGAPVVIPHGPSLLKGMHWDSPLSAFKIAVATVRDNGGILGACLKVIEFVISRPWLSMVLIAPWALLGVHFWLLLLPLSAATALIGGQVATLSNYYSAPFIGLVWLGAILVPKKTPLKKRGQMMVWLSLSVLLIGSGGIEIFFSSRLSTELRREVSELTPCLSQTAGRGIVSTALVGLIKDSALRMKIISDRPSESTNEADVSFYLFTPNVGRYEFSHESAQKLLARLSNDSNWKRVGPGCVSTEKDSKDEVALFVRNEPPQQAK